MMFAIDGHAVRGREHWAFGLVLLLALINGLIYTFLVPPWQHYDEPGHFEFAWLIANREGLPEKESYDQAMRRDVAASMVEFDFFRGLNYQPDLIAQNEPVWIGISQVSKHPLYHWIAALPLRLLRSTDIILQLYSARLVSVILYLLSVVAAYGIMIELTPTGHPLRWMVPATLALLPGFTDIMTAVNDDVGASAFFSLFLWSSIRIYHRGFSWPRLFGLIAATLACFWTKNTITIAILLIIFPLAFSLLKKPFRRQVLAVLSIGAIAGVLSIFAWGDAANWTRYSILELPSRTSPSNPPLGAHAFQLMASPDGPPPQILQMLKSDQVERLRGQTVTLGAWIWADHEAQTRTPILLDSDKEIWQEVSVSIEPVFYSVTTTISKKTEHIRIALSPTITQNDASTTFYYDGLVLVEGDYSQSGPPEFKDAAGRRGVWGDHSFYNLIRNASAEKAWPRIRLKADRIITNYFPGQPSWILPNVLDWSPTAWYYRATARNLFFTFWGKFGWGHIALTGYHPYRFLIAVTLLGIFGFFTAFLRRRKSIPWEHVTLLGAAFLSIWSFAFIRGFASINESIFIPSARYAYPAIIPTLLVLNIGWLELFCYAERRFRWPQTAKTVILISFFLVLNSIGILSIVRYY